MYTRKPKLSVKAQIEHLKSKGVTFCIDSEEAALEYLKKNNNYFKLTAYRKNYVKDREGKYIGLDFAYLKDIAIIDMRIRYCLLQMCLDIEHTARVHLVKAIEENPNEDGYSVVEDFRKEFSDIVARAILRAEKSLYCADLIDKYKQDMPIWAFVEILQFSDLCILYRFIAQRLNNRNMLNDFYMFQEIRQLRNACAHSNCLLNNLKSGEGKGHRADMKMLNELSKIGISKGIRQRKMSNDRTRQIITLLYVYKNYIESNGLIVHKTKRLHEEFVQRMNRHKAYYESSEPLLTTFAFFQKVIDNWYPQEV